jgi:NADH-quinone oxidoreductase subunit L
MPTTFATWLVGVLALAGVPVFSGFFSKDAVLEAVWHASPAVATSLFAASALTAFYVARTTRLAFFGPPAEGLHAHESGPSMLVPLVVLAVPAAVLGFAAAPVAEALGHEPEPLAIGISAAAVALAVVGGAAGWLLSAGPAADTRTARAMGSIHPVLRAAFRFDDAVDRLVVRPIVGASRGVWAVGDRMIADGLAEGGARSAKRVGRTLSSLQSGDAQSYGLAIAIGAVLMLVAGVWLGR